jgi:hypothetical protein
MRLAEHPQQALAASTNIDHLRRDVILDLLRGGMDRASDARPDINTMNCKAWQ